MTATRELLIFNWQRPRRRKLAIAGFIFVSFLAHAGGFYIFQIVYPPTLALLPPPARVNLITSNSEQGRTLLRWVEAEDPALVSTTRRPPEAKPYELPRLQHVPSYFAIKPALKRPPPLEVDLRVPSSQPPRAVSVVGRPPVRPTTPVPTAVSFSKELEAVGPADFPVTKFTVTSAQPPESVRFQIAVGAAGEVLYAFALNSSGDATLDEQARNYLARAHFHRRAGAPSLFWGTATVEWGNDVAHPEPASTHPAP
jgi:hypothetical protein